MDRRLGAISLLCSTFRETRAGCAFVLPLAPAASLSSSLLCSSIHHPQLGTSTLHPDAMAALAPFHSLGVSEHAAGMLLSCLVSGFFPS
jgi:hypothetical protein